MSMDTAAPAPAEDHSKDYIAMEQVIGTMVEGPYGWHEYCEEHGAAILHLYPGRHHRSISLWEGQQNWRPLKCGACSKTLWKVT